MLISVIMGIYNMNDIDLAKESIDSLLNQSFSNLEIIICNDGSTNEEYSIIEKYAMRDNRVILVHNKNNMGLAYSLNKAMQIASGEFIARMDIDDTINLFKLEKQYDFLKKNPRYSFVGTNANLVNENGIWGVVKVPEYPSIYDFYKNSPFIHASIMIRKNVLLAVGGYRVSKETRRAEDYDLFMRLYAESYIGANIQENLYNITENKEAYTRRKYIYRIDEAIVRFKGFRNLKILFPKGFFYILKPLLVGLIPVNLMMKIRGRRDKNE